MARMASGGRHGLAQSLFQVGGNTGSAIGPLRRRVHRAAARPVERRVVLGGGAARDRGALARRPAGTEHQRARVAAIRADAGQGHPTLSPGQVRLALGVLIVLIFSKYVYLASISSYYTFYLIHHFGVGVAERPAPPLRLPRRGGRRHDHRRARWATASAASW